MNKEIKITAFDSIEDRFLDAVELLGRVIAKQDNPSYLEFRQKEGLNIEVEINENN